MDNLNFIIGKRLSKLRKSNGLTQSELAERLNYSDKAVSKWEQGESMPKWEQGESMPGIEVLYRLSKLYGVSLDYIVGEESVCAPPSPVRKNRTAITLLSVLAVWLTATVIYVLCDIFSGFKPWTVFCWSVPASFIVTVVFDVIWHGKRLFFCLFHCLCGRSFYVCVSSFSITIYGLYSA